MYAYGANIGKSANYPGGSEEIKMSGEHTPEMLRELQAMPLEAKILMTKARITEFYTGYGSSKGYGNCYVSFSGGKDSTVLLHIARGLYPDIPAVFSNTGLEYPEIQQFVREQENIEIIRPKMLFSDVLSLYGYPLISKEVSEAIESARKLRVKKYKWRDQNRNELRGKRYDNGEKSDYNKEKWYALATELPVLITKRCCDYIKKKPLRKYEKDNNQYPIIASLAEESILRKSLWIRYGCNSYDGVVNSKPLSFWTEQDILQYIYINGIPYCKVYGEIIKDTNDKFYCTGCKRTGCIFCAFGLHREKGETRFQRLAKTHPRQYEYCLGGGQWVDNPHYEPAAPVYDGEWKNWNPRKIWVRSKEGLGYRKVFEMVNEIYGKDFYRYE